MFVYKLINLYYYFIGSSTYNFNGYTTYQLGMGHYILPPFRKLRPEVRASYTHIDNYVFRD